MKHGMSSWKRMLQGTLVAATAMLLAGSAASAQVQYVPTINTVLGTGTSGSSGDGGAGTKAQISNGMRQIATDSQGNVYATDTTYNVIRKVDARTGIVTTVAGNGTTCSNATATSGACGDGTLATVAQLNNARGIAVDASGNIYLADYTDQRVRVVNAATGIISTLAGKGSTCSGPATNTCGDGGLGTAAQLDSPSAVAVDTLGNLYILDAFDYKVRKVVLKTGIITTVAGTGVSGYSGDGGPATAAQISPATGIACDAAGNIYIADDNNRRVRMVQVSTGIITTIAGTGATGITGNGGPATAALLAAPYNLAVDSSGNIYVADSSAYQIREILATATGASPTFGNIVAVAGTGVNSSTGDGGLPTKATLAGPNGVAVDPFNNIFIGDTFGSRVRKVSFVIPLPATSVGSTTAAATNFDFQTSAAYTLTTGGFPTGFGEFAAGTLSGCSLNANIASGTVCAVPFKFTPSYPGLRTASFRLGDASGNLFPLGISGYGLAPSIAFTPGTISTLAGTGAAAFTGDGGAALAAALNSPSNLTLDAANNLYIADTANHVIRRIDVSTGAIATVAGTGGTSGYTGDNGAATSATLNAPQAVALDAAGNLYIADTGNHAIREVLAQTGRIVTIAGGNGNGSGGDGGAAIAAKLSSPAGVAFDPNGNLYIADTGNNAIRRVNTFTGVIAIFAGNGTAGNTGDGGAATSAALNAPAGLFVHASGLLFIATPAANTVRRINLNSGIITTAAGTGSAGYTGDGALGTAAQLKSPSGVYADAAGNLYIADTGNAVVRRLDAASGNIASIAGNGTAGSSGDGGAATSATLRAPAGIALDGAANLYIADKSSSVLRKIDVSKGATLAFGSQGIFATSAAKQLTLTNTGNQSLTLSGLSIANSLQQAATGGTDCKATTVLAAGSSCSISLTFEPLATGSYTGSIVVTDNTLNATSATQTTQITATGVASTNALLSVVTGNNQAAKINSPLGIGLQALLTDANGTPLAGQSVLFTPPATGATGSFVGGASSVAVVTDANGNATAPVFTVNGSTGAYVVTASFVSAAAPLQFSLTNVLNQFATATALTVSPGGSSQLYGQPITLAAATSPASQAGSTLSGSVVFYDGKTVVATVPVTNATAQYVVTAPTVGAHNYQAVYAGDLNFAPSSSTVAAITILKAPISISPSALSTYFGQGTTTITLAGPITGSGIGTPTGTITYTVGASTASTATLNKGQATLSLPSGLAAGSYAVTITYPGDSNYATGGGALTLSVLQPNFVLSANASSMTVLQGAQATNTLTVTPLGNLAGTVTLGCSGLPLYTACVFNTVAVSAGNPPNALTFAGSSASQSVQFYIVAQSTTGSLRQNGKKGIVFAWLLPGLLSLCVLCRQRGKLATRMRPALLMLALACVGALAGCGSQHTNAPVPFAGTADITITATGSVNNVVQSLKISLTVQPGS